jgi:hypothetical protein
MMLKKKKKVKKRKQHPYRSQEGPSLLHLLPVPQTRALFLEGRRSCGGAGTWMCHQTQFLSLSSQQMALPLPWPSPHEPCVHLLLAAGSLEATIDQQALPLSFHGRLVEQFAPHHH